MPTAIDDNIRTVSQHYDRLFDLVDRDKTYHSEGFRQRPPIVNMGYWLHHPKTAREAQEHLVRELAARIPDLPGKRVVDVGCGLAGPAILLASDYGAEVDGVNIVGRQIEWARRYITGNGVADRVRVHFASAMDLPFADQSFDVVFCLEAAHCFVDKQRFLQEAHRVLRDGGKFVMADIVGTTRLPVLNWQPALKLNLITAADWEDMLAGTGFKTAELKMIGKAVYPGCRWWAAQTSAEKRMAIFTKSCRSDASPLVRKLMMLRAALIEFLYFRSVLLFLSRLRLREFVLIAADKPA
ncbi:MAG TPA: class I SAM-dependent methyltransferase [Stellaceae bacterium]|nr:class I SAM-dependent methyltransferase [Stellaceae bacterium]